MKKLLITFLCVVMVMVFMPTMAFAGTATPYGDWTTEDGYGSIVDNQDGTYTFKGGAEGSWGKTGPYTKADAGNMKDGIVTKIPVYLDPAELTNLAAGSTLNTFSVSVALDKDGAYECDNMFMFRKEADGKLYVQVCSWNAVADEASSDKLYENGEKVVIDEAGTYNLIWNFYVKEGKSYLEYKIEKHGEVVYETDAIDLKINAADLTKVTRRNVWFTGINEDDGIKVGPCKAAVKTDAKEATCTAEGNIAYWYCETCDMYFSDEALTHEIAKEDATLAKLAHTYKDGKCTVCQAVDPNYKAPAKDVPKTSDANNMLPWLTAMVLAAGAAVVLKRREN